MNFDRSDIEQFGQRYRATFINSLTGFKSANLIGTVSSKGQENLAIFSQVFHLGAHPPLIGMIVRPHSTARHTLENILETGHYTLNHLNERIFKQAHQTSARYHQEVSEFEATGLTPFYHESFSAPFVEESCIRLGMQLQDHQTLKVNNTVLVIGSIEHIYLENQAIIQEDGFVNLEQAGSLTTSGLDSYHITKRLARLAYAKADNSIST